MNASYMSAESGTVDAISDRVAPNIVVYTQEYPTPNNPTDGVFTQQLVDALPQYANVTVVRPLPWWPAWRLARAISSWTPSTGIPLRTKRGVSDVYFPRVPLIPFVTRMLNPIIQALRAYPILRRMKRLGKLDVLNVHSVYPDGVTGAMLARWLDVPLVLTALGSDINVSLTKPFQLRQVKWALRTASACVGVSDDLCEKMRRLGARVEVRRIPNGIDKKRFYPPKSLANEQPVVLFVGRLHPVKGLQYLVAAVGELKRAGALNFKTVIVGEGGEEGALRAQCAELGIEKDVSFVGARSHDEIGDWMRTASVFCLPSLNEGMPNVLIEAQACAVPIVASNVGGIPEIVSADTGLLVPPANPSALAEALKAAVSKNWNRQKIAENVAWADWNQTAKQYAELIARIR